MGCICMAFRVARSLRPVRMGREKPEIKCDMCMSPGNDVGMSEEGTLGCGQSSMLELPSNDRVIPPPPHHLHAYLTSW